MITDWIIGPVSRCSWTLFIVFTRVIFALLASLSPARLDGLPSYQFDREKLFTFDNSPSSHEIISIGHRNPLIII